MPEKEAFIGESERPEVKLDPDAPLSELRVRDLSAILNVAKSTRAELKNPNWEKYIKVEKYEKIEKIEKLEKFEKIEDIKWVWEPPPKFREPPYGEIFDDPRILEGINQVVTSVSQLQAQVQDLAGRVGKLEGGGG
jgi:hypothetical protein